MKERFTVTGMTCAACSAHVEKAVAAVPGVSEVQVNLLAGTMTAELQDVSADAVVTAVQRAGYGATINGQKQEPRQDKDAALQSMKRRIILSFVFLALLMYVSMGAMVGLPLPGVLTGKENAAAFALTQLLLTLPIVLVNRTYFTNGFKTLFHGAPTMDALIAVGSGAALLYGVFALYQIGYGLGHQDLARVHEYMHDLYFESAGMILTLVTLGKYFETRAKQRTGEAIARLMELRPQTANILRDGTEVTIPTADVIVGDLIVVRPGQSIPVDGVITEGSTAIDEAALTGESLPVEKAAGDTVSAATINKTGVFTFRASRVGDDTTLSQIIRLVEEASASKAPIAKLADRVAGIFVPVVLVIALVTCVLWLIAGESFTFALSCAIAVLVISCPCALGLATPVAIMVGTGVGAENGVIFRSAEALERLHSVNEVVLDKTGTVTEGHPRVTDVVPFGVNRTTLLTLANTLEGPSEHPLAEAIVSYAKEHTIPMQKVDGFEAVPGRGLRAVMQGQACLAGNRRWMEENKIDLTAAVGAAEQLAQDGKTPMYFAQNSVLVGIIAIADVVKETSAEAVRAFQKNGIEVTLLTGDNRVTAEAIRRQTGIPRVIAEVLPQDKEREIRALQEKNRMVAMIGDGINDAPALARADVGIAIGAGADVAIESADVVLMKSDLVDAVNAVRLSRAVIRNIKQNLFWAFFYNCVGIPLAAGLLFPIWGLKLSPMFGAAAMSLSSVCVVSNALRLKLFRPLSADLKRKEEVKMKKTITIEGMMCQNCSGHVKKALEAVPGVQTVEVSHETGKAKLTLSEAVSDDALKQAVTEAGYQVVWIE